MCLLLSWDSLSNLSQETVLRLTTIDMLMKMGCGNTFGKLPWPEVRQDCSFSYKYICSLKEKKPGNCYLRANLTVKTLATHSCCVKSEWSFKFVYFIVSKVWVVPVAHNLCESSWNCTYKLYIQRTGVFNCLFLLLEAIRILIFGCFLVPDYHHEVYKISEFSHDVNGETKETQPIFLGRFLCQLISQQNSVAWPFAASGAG